MLAIGTVMRLDDRITGFDRNKRGRPCCVVGSSGQPPHEYYVAPRSTERGSYAVETPADVVPGLDEKGWFNVLPRVIPSEAAEEAPVLGPLPKAFLDVLLDRINFAALDVDL